MAVHLGTTVELTPGGTTVELTSAHDASPARVPLDVADPAAATPDWARYVAGVVAELRPQVGGRGNVSTTLPVGAGLSYRAVLEVAVAPDLGFVGPPLARAPLCHSHET